VLAYCLYIIVDNESKGSPGHGDRLGQLRNVGKPEAILVNDIEHNFRRRFRNVTRFGSFFVNTEGYLSTYPTSPLHNRNCDHLIVLETSVSVSETRSHAPLVPWLRSQHGSAGRLLFCHDCRGFLHQRLPIGIGHSSVPGHLLVAEIDSIVGPITSIQRAITTTFFSGFLPCCSDCDGPVSILFSGTDPIRVFDELREILLRMIVSGRAWTDTEPIRPARLTAHSTIHRTLVLFV